MVILLQKTPLLKLKANSAAQAQQVVRLVLENSKRVSQNHELLLRRIRSNRDSIQESPQRKYNWIQKCELTFTL